MGYNNTIILREIKKITFNKTKSYNIFKQKNYDFHNIVD
jgi:hypothetical protein